MTLQRNSAPFLPALISSRKMQQLTGLDARQVLVALRQGHPSPLVDGDEREIRPAGTGADGAAVRWPTYRILAGLGMTENEARRRLGLAPLAPDDAYTHPASR